MSRAECLTAIERDWRDLAPASIGPDHSADPGSDHNADHGADPGQADGDQFAREAVIRFAHEAVIRQAGRRPAALAVSIGRARLSYGELSQSAARLARLLAEAGAAPETVVGVCLERGADWVRAILAVMQAGAAYLPLDPALPPARLTEICAEARAAMVITADSGSFPSPGARVFPLPGLAGELTRYPATPPGVRPHPDNLCYIIHTSGSTGPAKAVAVSYGDLARTVAAVTAEYETGETDRVAQLAPMSADTSLEQLFTTLTAGATLVIPPPGTVAPSDLLRGIERKQVTVLDLTPAYWHQLLALIRPGDERLRSLRLMITGGELADPADCAAALSAAPRARLLNAYGLTETTITSSLCDVGAWLRARPAAAAPPAIVPVGTPTGSARIMVLDERLDPVPDGGTGEVYIGGSVARGYLGRPALTAERFLPDAGGGPGARMYRTGDLGRWLADGNLEVAGRADRQVQVRGYRVEPAEIEQALATHPDVGEVSVAPSAHGPGGTRLVAYYTPRSGGTAAHHPPAAELRHYLLDRLPGYMVPSAFVARRHLPGHGDGHGKHADGDALPQPGPAQHYTPAQQHAPAQQDTRAQQDTSAQQYTPAEAGLSALWGRLLGVQHVGLDDDFFAVGGNSLLAAEMLAHTRAIFGLSPESARPLTRRLLRDPTLRTFAAAVADARAGRLDADGDQPALDFRREARLGRTLRRDQAPSPPRPDWRDPREVLLTGATGFLGAHLLHELITATSARVWCLVRAADEADARDRVTRAAERYELAAPPAGRVVPLPGDLAEPRLGLSEAAFRDLARELDVIYHAGAQVNFIYPYQELRAANVAGTREVIRLAGLYRGIPVHYVSTTAVLAGLGVAGVREVTEETPLAHPDRLRMGYVETKYVAEELLRSASRAGLPVAVYRPLDIVGSVDTGAWSTATEMCALIHFIAVTGLAPDIDLPLDMVAADVCAAAIRHVSVSREATGLTYHLASPRQAPLRSLVARLRHRGYPITEIPFSEWTRELARQAARDPTEPMSAFLPLFVDRDSDSGLTVAEMYLARVFPAYSRSNTERALRGSGIAFAPVDGELLDRNIDRLMETGYLPVPPGAHRPAHVG